MKWNLFKCKFLMHYNKHTDFCTWKKKHFSIVILLKIIFKIYLYFLSIFTRAIIFVRMRDIFSNQKVTPKRIFHKNFFEIFEISNYEKYLSFSVGISQIYYYLKHNKDKIFFMKKIKSSPAIWQKCIVYIKQSYKRISAILCGQLLLTRFITKYWALCVTARQYKELRTPIRQIMQR